MAERIDELQLGIGSDATKAIEQLSRLSEALSGTADQAQRLASHSAGVNSFVSSIKNLSGTKWKPIINNLTKLSNIDLSNLENKSIDLGLSTNGDSQAVTNLTNVTKAMDKLSRTRKVNLSIGDSPLRAGLAAGLNSLSRSMSGLFRTSLQLGGQGASALGNFMGRLGLIPRHTSNVNNMALSFGNLLRAVLPFVGLRGVFGWLKESVELGSSIVEIQNVIDTAFGSLRKGYEDISGYVYKWSKTTIDAFGVSELAALRYAGRLQSIFNSSGFDVSEKMRDSAAKMTTDLIERAGDIASFYDITVDEAMTKMISGLAGMSRPLRSLGVNMSVANLQAFALSQGINTSWKEMDQATQMALRYQYILNGTKYAENDFQRTSLSLANQLRLLSLNFQVLSSTIGQGLVSAIAPAISWLNALIRRLIQAANAFRTFMWTLFGKPLAAARGYADDIFGSIEDSADAVGDLGSGAGGASDGLGKAGKAAKELKKQLTVLPFDELNQLAKDTSSAGSGGSGGGGGGGGAGGLGGLDTSGLLPDFAADLDNSPVIDAINEWARRIRMAFVQRDWGKLGLTIADGINKGFKKLYDLLDWDKWKDKVYNFIQPFQATMNSLVAGVDFDLIGRTLARGLNFITRTFRMWINGFNWRDWGKKLAEGMNGLLDEWDADALGRAIADKFRAAWNFFGGWVREFDFTLFGQRLKEGIHGAIDELNPKDMGSSIATFFNGISDSIISMLKDGTVREDLGTAFADLVNGFIEDFDEEDAAYALSLLKDTLLGGIADALGKIDKSALAYKLSTVLSSLPWGHIALLIGAKAGASLALGIFGTAFKLKAAQIITGIGVGGGTGGATAGATAGASGATGASGGISSTLVGVGVKSGIMAVGIPAALFALGGFMRHMVNKTGGIQQFLNKNLGSGDKTDVAESQTKNQKALEKAGINGAGYSTKIQTVPQTGSKGTNTTNTVTTVLKGVTDGSFKQLQTGVKELSKDPTVTKTLDGVQTPKFKTGAEAFHALKNGTAVKTADGTWTSRFTKTKTEYHGIKDGKATKTVYGSRTAGFNTAYTQYIAVKTNKATKKVTAEKTSQFDSILTKWNGFSDKWVKLHVQADLSGMVKKIRAWQNDNDYTNVLWTTIDYYAKGGLFTGPTGMAVFGEAGSEAAIPLERKSTMKKIASAIVDSGGFNTGTNSDLANDIAVRVAPIIMDAMASQNQRPINVNATLYTENNEVLAKAVNRGNRSLDKRYHPVAQYSY